jgi:chemosensory pili system protein ChpB (putative protein-glutamate methylesterase)
VSANDSGFVGSGLSKRVALLARPGAAREHLRLALHEAGAEIVLEDDPNTLEAQSLVDAAPQAVLVALDAAIEESLSRFDSVLHDPSVAVIFEVMRMAEFEVAKRPKRRN